MRQSCSLAEIELYAEGVNVARNAKVIGTMPIHVDGNRVKSLFDGKNRFGAILSMHEWMHQLAERQTLELQMGQLNEQLEAANQLVRQLLQWTVLVFVCVLAGLSGVASPRVSSDRTPFCGECVR